MNPSFFAAAPGGARCFRAARVAAAIGGALALAATTRADSTLNMSLTPNLAVPDGNTSGTFSEIGVPAGTGLVTDVNLKLTIAGTGPGGGWNGDLYILLTHAGRASYLVNRPGRDSAGLWGYSDNGFSELVFDDEASGDAHVYQDTLGVPADPASPVTGTVQPDGRGKDPMVVLDTDPAMVSVQFAPVSRVRFKMQGVFETASVSVGFAGLNWPLNTLLVPTRRM